MKFTEGFRKLDFFLSPSTLTEIGLGVFSRCWGSDISLFPSVKYKRQADSSMRSVTPNHKAVSSCWIAASPMRWK